MSKKDEKEIAQDQKIMSKINEALKADNYYIMIATPQEIFEAQFNKPIPEICHLLDFTHLKKIDELKEAVKKQNTYFMK